MTPRRCGKAEFMGLAAFTEEMAERYREAVRKCVTPVKVLSALSLEPLIALSSENPPCLSSQKKKCKSSLTLVTTTTSGFSFEFAAPKASYAYMCLFRIGVDYQITTV
jgi:hypothetical protein